MRSNFERLQIVQKVINQAYVENFSCLFHVEPRILQRCPKPGVRWSGPFLALRIKNNPYLNFTKFSHQIFRNLFKFLYFFAHILYENNSFRVHKNSTKFYEKKFKIKSTNLCFSMYPDLRCSWVNGSKFDHRWVPKKHRICWDSFGCFSSFDFWCLLGNFRFRFPRCNLTNYLLLLLLTNFLILFRVFWHFYVAVGSCVSFR